MLEYNKNKYCENCLICGYETENFYACDTCWELFCNKQYKTDHIIIPDYIPEEQKDKYIIQLIKKYKKDSIK